MGVERKKQTIWQKVQKTQTLILYPLHLNQLFGSSGMKRHFVACIYACCLVGCVSPEHELDNPSDTATSVKTDTVPLSQTPSLKEFHGNFQGLSHRYEIATITAEEFQKLPVARIPSSDKIMEVPCTENLDECFSKTESSRIAPFANLVARKGDRLTLKCGASSDSSVTIVDNKNEGDDYVAYKFEHKYTNPDFYFLTTSFYEGRGYRIVNQRTCEVLDISGIPVISPDRKRAVATNVDLEAGFDFNGIEFLRFENDKIIVDATQLFENWGIPKIEWLSNTSLKAVQITSQPDAETTCDSIKTHFAKILIK